MEKKIKFLNAESSDINISKSISLEDFSQFVVSVVHMIFDNDEYKPYYKEFIYRYNIVEYFTDIDLDGVKASDFWNFAFSDRMKEILNNIPNDILKSLDSAIDNLIRFRYDKLINSQKISLDKLMKSISGILEKAEYILENTEEIPENAVN